MLTCSKCGFANVEPKIIDVNGQLTAWCRSCGEYLKNVPRSAFWLDLFSAQKPTAPKLLMACPTCYIVGVPTLNETESAGFGAFCKFCSRLIRIVPHTGVFQEVYDAQTV